MKILRINDGNGYFALEENNWKEIDQVGKDQLMQLLDILLAGDVEMDSPDELKISNAAHLIIYKSIYSKFRGLDGNKRKFKDEADCTYLEQIQKYSSC